ncbi:MAG TPA: hypothetical protein DCM87_00280, partial [Planctomycetes bacterium]|nr:hypothetical protein [Planctomycetota bacterium]
MRYLPILSCLCAVCSGATLVVAPAGGGDYTEIQLAIDAAADGDEVLVKPGEYVITVPITFRGKAIAVRGEAGADVTVIKMVAQPADPDRASVVIFESGETEASVLDGVTLTGGKGSLLSGWWGKFGGGVQCVGASPTLTNCTISGNSGGGVYCSGSSPTLTNCTISGNSGFSGGGVSCGEDSSPTLTDCTISGNSAMSPYGASGGGVYCYKNSSPTLTNCTISGNSASEGYGGGVYCCEGSSPTLTNCTISGNWAYSGGGVCCYVGSPTLTNCTISGNWAYSGGGVYCLENPSPTLTNCIVWGNGGGSFVISGEDSAPDVTFSCLETWAVWPGQGNINTDPLFCGFAGPAEAFVDGASPEGGDGSAERPFRNLSAALEFSLSLRAHSPCIGTGKDGGNMGADLGTCEAGDPWEPRVVHVAAGRYTVGGLSLSQGASILGAGPDETVLEGTVWGLRTGATLSGVTVTGGGRIVIGGGDSPSIDDCTISGNSGGGVYCCYNSSPTLTNCTISGNSGSGVYCYENSSPTLTNCTISGNSGSGVYCYSGSSPTLTDCTISGNAGSYDGGGVYCYNSSSPTLTDCTISRNYSAWNGYGGGVYCSNSSPTLTNCAISGNWAGHGGGVYCGEGSSPTLTNCAISGNSAYSYGGGVYCSGSSPTLTNCTISGNWARSGGGVHCSGGSAPTLTNCIVWGNGGGSFVISGEDSAPDVTFSCLETWAVWPGEGNINTDPLFCGFAGPAEAFVDGASPEGGDGSAERPFRDLSAALEFSLSLKANSPCIGAGKDDGNMGADLGTCEAADPWEPRVVHVAAGRYTVGGLSLSQGASILGAGADETVLEGTVWGLRTGATLSGVTVTGGTSGGVVIVGGESPSIEDCTISGNSASYGGGVLCERNSSPTLTNCTISGNWAYSGGGVYCRENSSPTLTNCTISGNSGSGVYCYENSSPTLTNCTISGNSAGYGGGVYCYYSSPTLTNCTISGNSAP